MPSAEPGKIVGRTHLDVLMILGRARPRLDTLGPKARFIELIMLDNCAASPFAIFPQPHRGKGPQAPPGYPPPEGGNGYAWGEDHPQGGRNRTPEGGDAAFRTWEGRTHACTQPHPTATVSHGLRSLVCMALFNHPERGEGSPLGRSSAESSPHSTPWVLRLAGAPYSPELPPE